MGYVYLYHGTGAGKTTSALGLALRSIGQGRKAVIVQFLKWWKDTGEYKIMERLGPDYVIRQFGRPGWICQDVSKTEVNEGGLSLKVRRIEEEDKESALEGLEFARKALLDRPGLMVLDEACLAAHLGILEVGDILALLRDVPEDTDVVLTGRFAPKELIDRADFVNEVVGRKAPERFVTTRGIQY
ncbi:cob(I)yrinic acid a,c-diamide adenosyltransferase [Methanocella conradii]|uniref:cob(I)yrinic acid a,c-diamide adenosyltransferase n=1 Tax=Methanocella conradii TaxID=1175444 RepID=UPI0024B35D9F|nr:cob(I)yrinic acid a,c-diamide adenosyltransferase [Methanocella conradii]MDI6898032.1 cob(I)yrinic acid a,c-diamide adenosyltransferase [Methanocella conradii]